VRDASPATWAFWVHAGTQARFKEGYRRIAETAKMDGWDDPKADVLRLVRSWLCDESNGRWTMVVDNADDASVFFSSPLTAQAADDARPGQAAELLSDFLPQSPNGSVLVSSRSRDVAYRLIGSLTSIFEVKPMEEDDALILLQNKLSLPADAGVDIERARELLQALDRMPLAITQAAAYIVQRRPRMSVTRYLDEICRDDRNRARLLEKDVGDSRRDGRASNSVIATWHISFEHIRQEMPAAARLLSLMSFFDRQGIPESLLRDRYAADQDKEHADFDDDIYTLTSYSLVEISSANGSEFEMHRLVQYSTKKWLELCSELEEWKARYATMMDSSYPVAQYDNWKVLHALFPHVQAAVDCRPGEGEAKALESWASVLSKAAWYANAIGQHEVAKEMVRSGLEVREKVLGPEHLDTLASMSNLALVLNSQGKYKEAEAMNRETLERRERVLGPEHPDTLTSMNNLASMLKSQGKYEEAEAMNRETLALREKVLGPEHPDTPTSVNNLACLLARRHHYEESLALYERACTTYQTVLGTDHPTSRLCRRNYIEAQRRSEQVLSNNSTQGLDSTASVVTGKASRFARGLAKIGLRSPKTVSS
jgi:tetratricopeptide (TPR) repeat protein